MNFKSALLKGKTCPTANQPVAAVPTRTSVSVCFRKTEKDKNGLQKHVHRAGTCNDLVQFALLRLQPTWSEFGISEEPMLVVQEAETGGANTNVVEKQHNDPVEAGKVYTILECWTKTPVKLLRRVRLDDAGVTTYTHPDKISLSPLTRLSPLACAALRRNELQIPWCSSLPDGSINVHGISVGLNDDATRLGRAVDPFAPIPIGSKESVGVTSMSLAHYVDLVPKTETRHPLRGILQTSISHKGFLVRGENSQVEIPGKKKKQAGQVTKRMVNWRFALQEGFDLSEHGMMLVWDNSHLGHCSLVRLKETGEKRKWMSVTNGGFYGPFLPEEVFIAGQGLADDSEGFQDVLRNTAFVCMPDEEPEPILGARAMAGKEGIAFPKLASQFTLYDIRMEATAEPQPIQNFRKESQTKLYQAVVVLYYINSDSWIQQLLKGVEEVDYDVEMLSSVECSRLAEAIKLASSELDDETKDAYTDEKLSDLDEGWDVLCEPLSSSSFIEHALPQTPAPSTRQEPSQGDSPDSGINSDGTEATKASTAPSEVYIVAENEAFIGSSSSDTNGSSSA